MARQKNDGKGRLGGRRKGTLNRATTSLRQWVEDIVNDNREQIKEDLRNMEATDRVKLLEKFISYVLPRKKEVTIQEETEALLQGIDRLSDEQLSRLEELITKIISNGRNPI